MCDSIRYTNGIDVGTVRQFQDTFKVDATKYGFDGNEHFLDSCMCQIDLEQFFKDHPEHQFYYACGEWWEGKKTAVEWFATQLYEKFEMKGDGRIMDELLEQAKQMEEQQIRIVLAKILMGILNDGISENDMPSIVESAIQSLKQPKQ